MNDKDDFAVIRRAVILRGLLEKQLGKDKLLSGAAILHPAVINAFLDVPEFRHGVRSIEAILEMSDFSEPSNQYTESALPPRTQLDMHTDAYEFIGRVQREVKPSS